MVTVSCPDPVRVQSWLAPPWQSRICSCVPAVVDAFGTSRHLLAPTACSAPEVLGGGMRRAAAVETEEGDGVGEHAGLRQGVARAGDADALDGGLRAGGAVAGAGPGRLRAIGGRRVSGSAPWRLVHCLISSPKLG